MDTRVCRDCKIAKPLTSYHQRKGKISDKQTKCKVCFNEQRRIADYAARWAGKGNRSSPEWRNITQGERDAVIKKFTETVLVQYNNDINSYIVARKKGVLHNSFCGVDIPETEEEENDLMEIIIGHLRRDNNNKQISRKQVPYGWVYGVWHPADYWKGWVKVGRSGIMRERLPGYQTADPWKNFETLFKILVVDRYAGEKLVLDYFKSEGYEVRDEWIRIEHDQFIDVLKLVRDDQEFSAVEILDEFRVWKEQQAM